MYKFVRSLLIITVFMLCSAVCVSAKSEYRISDAMIIEYTGNEDIVTVPAVIDGVEIVGIDTNAFCNKDMHTVIIEDGIEVIQPKAFAECHNLQYVNSPDSMLLINENAFFNCPSLKDLEVSEGTYVMDEETFTLFSEAESEDYNGFLYSNNTITGYIGTDSEITIPDSINDVSITAIAANAFANNTAITKVTIPDSITTIGDNAFKGCSRLVEVSLSKNLSFAGESAFSGCSLKNITIPGTLKRVSKNMFYECYSLLNVILEEGVNSIGHYAFYNCLRLESIQIPETLTAVETWTFGFCKKMKTFYIPDGCTYLDSAAFYYCSALNNINIPDTVTSIGTHCFRACGSLSQLTLPNTIKSIPYRSLNGCAFTEIKIPEAVTYIGSEAFYQCTELKNIEIPKSVSTIDAGAFYGCTNLNMMIIYGANTTLGSIFSASGSTSIGKNTMLYAIADSATEQSVKKKGLTYQSMCGTANIANASYLINGAKSDIDSKTLLVKDDSAYAKYTVINAGETSQDLCLMICIYDEEGRILTTSFEIDRVEASHYKNIDHDITVDENCYAKVLLVDSIGHLDPLYSAKEL